MATHKSAIKRYRQSVKKQKRNNHFESLAKSSIKKFTSALDSNQLDTTATLLKSATSTLSKVAGKGIIPKKRMSRKISQLSKKLHTTTLASKAPQSV